MLTKRFNFKWKQHELDLFGPEIELLNHLGYYGIQQPKSAYDPVVQTGARLLAILKLLRRSLPEAQEFEDLCSCALCKKYNNSAAASPCSTCPLSGVGYGCRYSNKRSAWGRLVNALFEENHLISKRQRRQEIWELLLLMRSLRLETTDV